MDKILLIEDRVNRQKKYLGEKLSDLNKYQNLVNICGGMEFDKVYNDFLCSRFEIINDFSCLLIHRSAFPVNTRNELIQFVKQRNLKVVFFSGGISDIELSQIGKSELLLIDVSKFYSKNLLVFLENNANNILELAFGKDWQISILADTLEKLILYCKSFKACPMIKIERDLNLNNWVRNQYFNLNSHSNVIELSILENLKEKISADLKRLI
jgi:hypothetical protein